MDRGLPNTVADLNDGHPDSGEDEQGDARRKVLDAAATDFPLVGDAGLEVGFGLRECRETGGFLCAMVYHDECPLFSVGCEGSGAVKPPISYVWPLPHGGGLCSFGS